MSVTKHPPEEANYSLEELAELGYKLSEQQLTKMNLFDKIYQAEQEIYWRLKAAYELLKNIEGELQENLKQRATNAENQYMNPVRGSAKRDGGKARGDRRSVPEPGTLIVREHRFQGWTSPKQKTFRFVVVEQPGSLILLGDKDSLIYNSPSRAARAATGNSSEKGWHFFEIFG